MPNSVGPTSCSRRSACRQTPAPSIVWIHSILRGDSPFLSGELPLRYRHRNGAPNGQKRSVYGGYGATEPRDIPTTVDGVPATSSVTETKTT